VLGSDGTFKKSSSDVRLKENIKTLDNSLDKILKLRGVTFTWKANPEYGTRIGFIAQEFEKIIPELSFTNPVDGYKGINYAEVTAVLVEAVKEQQKQIEALKAENSQLKADNNGFENRLKKLENMITGYANK
jgi:molecular chaperone GrpE (heat shock protein)